VSDTRVTVKVRPTYFFGGLISLINSIFIMGLALNLQHGHWLLIPFMTLSVGGILGILFSFMPTSDSDSRSR
jgi:hypothetical protein